MIKAVILDVDGVIIGSKPRINFPLPNAKVIRSLYEIHAHGITVILCTARPSFAVKRLAVAAGLDCDHVTFGGAQVANLLADTVTVEHAIDTSDAIEVVTGLKQNGWYTEAYTSNAYAIEKYAPNGLTQINARILRQKPRFVPSLESYVRSNPIVKIMPAAMNRDDKLQIEQTVGRHPGVELRWGGNPMYAPMVFGVITKRGITKHSAVETVLHARGLSYKNVLGIGDGLSDWDYLQYCGNIATVENADEELKTLVKSSGKSHFMGPSVDAHGILDIFSHFNLS